VIVTCPSCSSKYRVRDEAVPPTGAELQCPTCNAHFVAHPPKVDVDQLTSALDKVTRSRDAAESRAQDLERQLAAASDSQRTLQDQASTMRSAAAEAAETQRRLTDEVARLRAAAADTAELVQTKAQLFEAQKKQKASSAELEVANSLITTLQGEVNTLRAQAANPPALAQAQQKLSTLQAEVESLKSRLLAAEAEAERARNAPPPPSRVPPELAGLIGAVGPMLWGLDQALTYLEQFADGEPTLAGHVKQLRLLQKVLMRLGDAAK
jgi:predicted Zn finger-like uncharacterized protein